jgi:hypothetical protein
MQIFLFCFAKRFLTYNFEYNYLECCGESRKSSKMSYRSGLLLKANWQKRQYYTSTQQKWYFCAKLVAKAILSTIENRVEEKNSGDQ